MSPRSQQIDTRSATKLVASLVGHDSVISISRLILHFLDGDYPSAVLLCQAVYWQGKVETGKGGTQDGYFWKSMRDWHRETALSEYQVRAATKRLIKTGVLETTIRKAWSEPAHDMVPTVHYRVDMDNLLNLLLSLVSQESIPKKINNPYPKNRGMVPEEIDDSIYTETTKKTKTTTPLPPSLEAELLTQAAGDNDHKEVEEYIQLAAQEYCHSRGFGPEKFAGAMTSTGWVPMRWNWSGLRPTRSLPITGRR